MVFPTAEALTPCLTQRLSPETRKMWKERYLYAKKYGIRATFGVVTGTGCYTLVKEVATDVVKRHTKRYIGAILLNIGLTCILAGIFLMTNATKIVKYSKAFHSVCSAAWRGVHNIAECHLLFVITRYLVNMSLLAVRQIKIYLAMKRLISLMSLQNNFFKLFCKY